MRCGIFLFFFLLAGTLILPNLHAQDTPDSTTYRVIPSIKVGKIILTGNKKTRDEILLREIPFKEGDQFELSQLVTVCETIQKQLLNTTLFTQVYVSTIAVQDGIADIVITVKERWFVFPVPFFRPADRNLNQWIVEKHASLSRVNYGIKFQYNNATGSNDKLRMSLTSGYTRQVSFSYDRLYIDRKMKFGLKVAFATGRNHEINYNTLNDKQLFLKDENEYLRRFTHGSVQFTYRPAIKTRHSLGIGFITEHIGDTVAALNTRYFNSGKKRLSFPGIYYTLNYLDLDYIPYPTKGYAAEFSIGKSGWNREMNLCQFHMKLVGYWKLSEKSFFNVNMYGGIKLPFKQPYYNRRFLGYGDVNLQGFEYYVVDGMAGGYLKTAVNTRLVKFDIHTPSFKKDKRRGTIPFTIYGKIFGNTGYVYNPDPGENALSNMTLASAGIGIDIITAYDIIFRLEWSFNSLGENGLFLHRKSIF